MLKLKRIFFLPFILAILVGCEPDSVVPDQTRIYVSYGFNYNHSLEKTTAAATFYLDSTSNQIQQRLALNFPAKIMYDDNELVFDEDNRYYKKDFIGAVTSIFEYTNYDGDVFTNETYLIDSIQMNLSSDTADQQVDYTFTIEGSQLDTTEQIYVEVESINSGELLISNYPTTQNLNIQISAEQLQGLGIGKTVIRASRQKFNGTISQSTLAGGDMLLEYTIQDTFKIY